MGEIELGQYIVERLKQLDVKQVFGLPGMSTSRPFTFDKASCLVADLETISIHLILCYAFPRLHLRCPITIAHSGPYLDRRRLQPRMARLCRERQGHQLGRLDQRVERQL